MSDIRISVIVLIFQLFFFFPEEYCILVTLPITNPFAGYSCILCLVLTLPSVPVRAPQEDLVRKDQQPCPTQAMGILCMSHVRVVIKNVFH